MTTYVVLVRGINVGGLNKVSMAGLKKNPSVNEQCICSEDYNDRMII